MWDERLSLEETIDLAKWRKLEEETESISCQLSNSSSEKDYFSDRVVELGWIESCKSYKYVVGYQIEPYWETTFGQESFLFEFDFPTWIRDKLLLYKSRLRERLHSKHGWLFRVLGYNQQSTAYIRDVHRLYDLGFFGLGRAGDIFTRGWGKSISHLYRRISRFCVHNQSDVTLWSHINLNHRRNQSDVISWHHINSGCTVVKTSQYNLIDLSEAIRLITLDGLFSFDVTSGKWEFLKGLSEKVFSITSDSFLSYETQFDLRKQVSKLSKYLSNPTNFTYKYSTFTQSDNLWKVHHLLLSAVRIVWNLSKVVTVLNYPIRYLIPIENLLEVINQITLFNVLIWNFNNEPLEESFVLSEEEQVLFKSLENLDHKKSVNQYGTHLTYGMDDKKPYEMLGCWTTFKNSKVKKVGLGVTLGNLSVTYGDLKFSEYGYWFGKLTAYDQSEVSDHKVEVVNKLKNLLTDKGKFLASCWNLTIFRRKDIISPTKLGKWSSFYALRLIIPRFNDTLLAPTSPLRRWVRLIPLIEWVKQASLMLDQQVSDRLIFLQSVSKGERHLNGFDNLSLLTTVAYSSSYLTYQLEPIGYPLNVRLSYFSECVNDANNLVGEKISYLDVSDELTVKDRGTKFKPATLNSDNYSLEVLCFPESLRAKKGFLKSLNLGISLGTAICYNFVSLHSVPRDTQQDQAMLWLYASAYKYLKPFNSRVVQMLNLTITYLRDQLLDNNFTKLGLLLGTYVVSLSSSFNVLFIKNLIDYVNSFSWALPIHVLNFRNLQVDFSCILGEIKPKYNPKFNSFKSISLNLFKVTLTLLPWVSKLENLDTDGGQVDKVQRFKLKVVLLSLKEKSINSYTELPEVTYSLANEWWENFNNMWLIKFIRGRLASQDKDLLFYL